MSTMIDEPMESRAQLLEPIAPIEPLAPLEQKFRRPVQANEYFLPELCVEERSYRWRGLALAFVVVGLFAVVVFRFWGAGDGGVDQNAYLVGGRLLAEHFNMKLTLTNPYSYVGGMFVRFTDPTTTSGAPIPNGVYYPKYPFGLPLLYASFFWMFKLAAMVPMLKGHVDPNQAVYWAFLVSPVSSVVAVAGTFFLARQVAGSFAGILAAILLGSSQLMLMLADNPNSHAACLAFIVWGFYFCVRWMQTGRSWHGVLGGLLVGYAATIRYSEVLLFTALCVVVISRLPWNRLKTWRSVATALAMGVAVELIMLQSENSKSARDGLSTLWTPQHVHTNEAIVAVLCVAAEMGLVFSIIRLSKADWWMYLRAIVPGLAWAVPVGTLLLVNHHTMGSFTGYDSTHESEFGVGFKWEFFWRNWEKAVRVFYDLGLFFVVPFAVAGIVMLFRRSWRVGLMLLAWLVPGTMLYMAYYWSPDRADAYARFFLTYLPALVVGAAVCFHDGLLIGRSESDRRSGVALTVAVGCVVAIASGVSLFRTVHGLRDGDQAARIPLEDFRERLSLSQTGQMVIAAKIPARSVLFAQNLGGVNTPSNYVQFLGDWDLYGLDTFSVEGSRRGFGGGNRQRNGRNGRPGNGRGGPQGGGQGGPGGPGGPGGGPPGMGNNVNGQNDPNAATATPMQPEQQEYHASLYKNKSARQLYQIEADIVNKALGEGRPVYILSGKDHQTGSESGGFGFFGNESAGDPFANFKDGLEEIQKYKYNVVSRWQDVSLPPDTEDDQSITDNNPMGGGRGGGGNANRMFMGSDRILDWQLVEITGVVKK